MVFGSFQSSNTKCDEEMVPERENEGCIGARQTNKLCPMKNWHKKR